MKNTSSNVGEEVDFSAIPAAVPYLAKPQPAELRSPASHNPDTSQQSKEEENRKQCFSFYHLHIFPSIREDSDVQLSQTFQSKHRNENFLYHLGGKKKHIVKLKIKSHDFIQE